MIRRQRASIEMATPKMTLAHILRNTPRMETAKILKRDPGENTAMFFSMELGPNSPDRLVTYCSMFGMLRVNAEVMMEKYCVQARSNVEKAM